MKKKQVESVSQYIALVEKIPSEIGKNHFMTPVLFRGESKKYKGVYASLFREGLSCNKNASSKSFDNINEEASLFEEVERMFPYIFKDCNDALDKMVKMQHYGMPTRLLDVTENPLVALYFACEDYKKNESDGRVLCVNSLTYKELDFAQNKAHLVAPWPLNLEFSSHDLGSFLHVDEDDYHTYIKLCDDFTVPFIFKPPVLNERLRAQKGAFIFSAIARFKTSSDEEKYNMIVSGKKDLSDILNLQFELTSKSLESVFSTVCEIPANNKEKIINE